MCPVVWRSSAWCWRCRVAIIATLTPKAEYLPEGEEQKIFAFMFAPPGYNIEVMHTIFKQLDSQFVPHVGEDPAKFAQG